jgi:hypothetical protein
LATAKSIRRHSWPRGISNDARKTLEQLAGALYAPPFAERLWQRALTEKDRRKLGGDLHAAAGNGGAVGMWMRLHGVNQLRALVDVADAVGYLKAQIRDWLLRELGEKQQVKKVDNSPVWDKSTGKLRLNGRTIRDVRVMRQPTNIQIILDAFQDANWPTQIRNPFINDDNPNLLHQAIRSLNKRLKSIRFHSSEGAKFVFWQRQSR